jgi:hypothetical protein
MDRRTDGQIDSYIPPQTLFVGDINSSTCTISPKCVQRGMYLVSATPTYWIFMKLYTVVVHYLQMCMKEYCCCLKFRRGHNSTYTLLQLCKVSKNSNKPFRRSCAYKVHAPPFRESISWIISPFKFWTATIFLHAHLQVVYYKCVKIHKNQGIPLLSKIWKGR